MNRVWRAERSCEEKGNGPCNQNQRTHILVRAGSNRIFNEEGRRASEGVCGRLNY